MSRPFAPYEWMLAMRYLRARRKESFISVISIFSLVGIALGVATLIVVISVMNSWHVKLLDEAISFSGHLRIESTQERGISTSGDLAERVGTLEGVATVIPVIESKALASVNGNATGVEVRGVRRADLESIPSVYNNQTLGSLEAFDTAGGLFVPSNLSISLPAFPGSFVTLISPNGPVTSFSTVPNRKAFRVVGSYSTHEMRFERPFVYLPFKDAQLFFALEDRASAYKVILTDKQNTDQTKTAVREVLPAGLEVRDWKQTNGTLWGVLQVEKNMMFIILALIILIAVFNIVSGLIMLVKDKGNDIAILRSMGATQGTVIRVFLIAGSAIGIVGTFAGFLLGTVISVNIVFIQEQIRRIPGLALNDAQLALLSELSTRVEVREVSAIILMSLFFSLVATIYPSWRAGHLDPVEALRYE